MNTKTIGEVLEELQELIDLGKCTKDTPLVITSNYGDRSRTEQALNVRRIEMVSLYETAYSETDRAVCDDEDDDGRAIGGEVVALRYC